MVGRIILGITGAFAVLIGGGIAVAGVLGVGIAGERVETSTIELASTTRAVVSPAAAIDIGGELPVIADDRLALRLRATPRGGKALFVGIAQAAEIDRWLGDAARDEVSDVSGRVAIMTRSGSGDGPPRDPLHAGIWAAQATGTGTLAVDWSLLDAPRGEWGAIVMNADGSPGARADASVGAGARVGVRARLDGDRARRHRVLAGLVAIVVAVRRPAASRSDAAPTFPAGPRDPGGLTGATAAAGCRAPPPRA